MSSIRSNLEAEFVFLNLHPEIKGDKVELLNTEQTWALSVLVSLLSSHHHPIWSSSCSFSQTPLSKKLLWEKMVIVHFPQEALGAHHRPQTEEFSVSEKHFFSRWAPKLHGAFSKNHICYHVMAQGTKPCTARLLDGLMNRAAGRPWTDGLNR